MTGIGLYVHVPFCRRRCGYCAFATTAGIDPTARKHYLASVIHEMSLWQGRATIETLFFGGGTPSLLEADEWRDLIAGIKGFFDCVSGAEWTLEAHPATLRGSAGRERLGVLAALGFNRISFGIESFSTETIRKLGRDYSWDDINDVIGAARDIGFGNINLDLIFGWPWESRRDFMDSLKNAMAMNVEHLSLYPLSIEPATPFATLGYKSDSDDQADLFMVAHETLSDAGWEHYEIANYARPGFRCRHNLKYWNFKDYLGLGNSSASKMGRQSFANVRAVENYIGRMGRGVRPYDHPENFNDQEERRRRVIMQLRLSEGVSDKELHEVAESNLIARFQELGYLIVEGWRARLSPRGWLLSHQLMSGIA
ncbi:MAG: radical SAM family heme chaperone HemW [Elusimicrobia bacterium]|nr:radical SAM family heme chaperone HemW [Elusimicrobiota bacterium]